MLTELRRERAPECITDLVFDEWAAGELPADDVTRLEAHVLSCGACAARKRQIDASAAKFRASAPELPRTTKKGKPALLRPWLAGASAALALAAAVTLYVRGAVDTEGPRAKGSAHVGFFVKRGDTVTEGHEGQRVRAGDQLRFVVTTDQPRHLVLLGLDSRGAVSVFSPSSTESIAVAAGQATPLDASVQLDDSPGREHVIAVFCDAPAAVAPLAAALKATGHVSPPAGCTLHAFDLVKETP